MANRNNVHIVRRGDQWGGSKGGWGEGVPAF